MEENKPYVYVDLNEVPEVWRRARGGRLRLDQVNSILSRAYEMGYNVDVEGHEKPLFVPDYGRARQEFVDAHTLINGFWVGNQNLVPENAE